jgi:hypothetical protein
MFSHTPVIEIYVYDDEDDDADANKLVWPAWAAGALFRGARRIHINRVYFHTPMALRSRDILVKDRKHPVVFQLL